MGCDFSKVYSIEIHLENELAVFEPRDEVAGHVLIRAEEDTAIDSCVIWLYGLVKSRWPAGSNSPFINPGSLFGGVQSLRSTTNLPQLTEQKGMQEICPNTIFCLNSVKENLRKELKHGIFKGQLGNSYYQSFLGLPWDLQCHKDQRQFPSSLDLDKKNDSKTSCTSMTDTLAASLIRENSDGSTVDCVKQSDLTSGNELNNSVTAQENACNSCETCMPKPHCTKWKSMVSVNEEVSKYISGVKVIYRVKVNLLDNHHLPTVLRNPDNHSITSKETSSCSNLHSPDKHFKNEPADKHSLEVTPDSRSICHKITTQSVGIGKLLPTSEPKQFGPNSASYVLTRGTHVLNFEFKLPADLPSSFELPTSCLAGGASARLYYGLRIEICNNSAQIRHTQQREIIVFRPLELTHFPRLRDRVTLHKEFIISGRCASPNGSILCDMSVNKTGFVPGESITPQVYVTNHSSRAIQTVHLTFAQTVLLQISEEQKHTEVLRLFAARLKAREPNPNSVNSNNTELIVQPNKRSHGDDNPSLFSSSLSPSVLSSSSSSSSSHITSSNRPDVFQSHRSTVHRSSSTKKLRPKAATDGIKSVHTENQVVVAAHGGSAYFEDVIHVPPLPATGLAGRQQMIRVDYMLILRLRLLGDEEGKLDQKMQIPITIGSDPTRETSFTNCTEVVPCYALFNYASGEVIEYDPSKQLQADSKRFHLSPVYRYFKPRTAQGKPNSDHSGQQSSDRSRVCSPPINHSHTGINPTRKMAHKDGYPTQEKNPSKKSGRRTPVLSNPYAADQTSSPMKPAFNRDKAVPAYLEKINCKTDSPCHSPPTPLLARQRFYDDGAQVSGDEQNDENYEEDQQSICFVSHQSNQTSSDPNSPVSGHYDVQIRQLAGGEIYEEPSFKGVTGIQTLASNVRRHGQSPKRQYSFEFYSDQTVSEDESSYQHSSSTFENVKNGALSDSSMQNDTNMLLVRPCFGSVHSLGAQKSRRETGKIILQASPVHEHMRARSSDRSYEAQKLWIPFSTPAFSTTDDQISDRYKCLSTGTQQKSHSHSLQSTITPTAALKVDVISKSTDSPPRRTLHHAYWNHPRVAPVPGRIANSDEIWTPGCVLDARGDMLNKLKMNAIPVNKGKQFQSPKHIHMQPADAVEVWKSGSEHKIACFSRNHSHSSTYSQHHGHWVAGGLGNIT
ncbi:hypothetical protein EG68_00526 [Paragonimus skrjabini miyazakii]|uniref:Arrestin C-terminal-like domain-containing protein n=1 Tax=Paragonimus skrjabini miyazakii TaxID=59628 RepID=A0A8S9ZCC7_9TREM|nr:hypothetical protein EG68_00526 [Paragonimus skrjabini miyazakii]